MGGKILYAMALTGCNFKYSVLFYVSPTGKSGKMTQKKVHGSHRNADWGAQGQPQPGVYYLLS